MSKTTKNTIVDKLKSTHNKSKNTKKGRIKSNKHLRADRNNLSNFEVRTLVAHCMENDDLISWLLLLILFTGRNLEKIYRNKDSFILYKNIQPAIKDSNNLTEPTFPDSTDFLATSESYLIILLPDIFKSVINKLKYDIDIKETLDQINNRIKKINKTKRTRLTIKRITNHIINWMHLNGIDTADISLITNMPISFTAASHYYQTSISELNNIYSKYVNDISPRFKISGNIDFSLKTGSHRVPRTSSLIQFYSNLRSSISKELDLKTKHNLITIYTLMVLNLNTGHRPVKDPYNKIDSFCFSLNTVCINDKSRSNDMDFRVVNLNAISINQIKLYLKSLDSLRSTLGFLDSKIRIHVQDVINNNKPLFWVFEKKKIVLITKKILSQYCEMYSGGTLFSNWNRHYLRTELKNLGVRYELIDLLLNHDDISGSGNTEFSSITRNDHIIINKAILEIFDNLKIIPFS